MKIEFENWFYRKCDNGTRMWSASTPNIQFIKSKGYFMFGISFFFWDLTIEIRQQ